MYLNSGKHILSNTIMQVALVRLTGASLSGLMRLVIKSKRLAGELPDMLNADIHVIQFSVSAIVLVLSTCLMLHALKLLAVQIKIIPEEDRQEIALLQEEFLGEKKAKLTAEITRKLLQIWLGIFTGIQLMYDILTDLYRHFASQLAAVLTEPDRMVDYTYVYLYNLSHGFKYQGMLVAILLGIMVTGIFLDDRVLKMLVMFIGLLYILSMAGMEMASFTFMGRHVGIVWSSIIFHTIETVGLMGLAVYLRIHYRGV